jgi:hypothetical protein
LDVASVKRRDSKISELQGRVQDKAMTLGVRL